MRFHFVYLAIRFRDKVGNKHPLVLPIPVDYHNNHDYDDYRFIARTDCFALRLHPDK